MPSDPQKPSEQSSWDDVPKTSTRDPLIGTTLGEYVVKRHLGAGAMGVVYEGLQQQLNKPVAIKVLQPNAYGHDADAAQRLMGEARAANAIRHPGIVDVYNYGTLPDGRPYLVMELIDGEPLDGLLTREAPLRLGKALSILDELLDALSAAHAAGVVHRDIKPGNIFVVGSRDGGAVHVKLLDFGLAKQSSKIANGAETNATTVVGTPYYMSPEQACAKPVGPRSDLYSVGCIAFQMLSGRLPYESGNPVEMLVKHLEEPIPRLSEVVQVPAALDALLFRLLAKNPDERPSSAAAVRQELRKIAASEAAALESPPHLVAGFAKTSMRLVAPDDGAPDPSQREPARAPSSPWDDKTVMKSSGQPELTGPPPPDPGTAARPKAKRSPSMPHAEKAAMNAPVREEGAASAQREASKPARRRSQPPPMAARPDDTIAMPVMRDAHPTPPPTKAMNLAPRRAGRARKIVAGALGVGLGLLLGVALLRPSASPGKAEPEAKKEAPEVAAPPVPEPTPVPVPDDKPAPTVEQPAADDPTRHPPTHPRPAPPPRPAVGHAKELRKQIRDQLDSMEKKSTDPAVLELVRGHRADMEAATSIQALRAIQREVADLKKRNGL